MKRLGVLILIALAAGVCTGRASAQTVTWTDGPKWTGSVVTFKGGYDLSANKATLELTSDTAEAIILSQDPNQLNVQVQKTFKVILTKDPNNLKTKGTFGVGIAMTSSDPWVVTIRISAINTTSNEPTYVHGIVKIVTKK